MSIATQIARLQSIKNAIKESLISRGVEATDHNMENFAEDIRNVKNKNMSVWYLESFGREDMGEENRVRYVDAEELKPSGIFQATQRTVIDMGKEKAYQYVNTENVPNANSGTYTFGSNNGSTVDMGANNTYRYANASNVYNYGYNSALAVETITNENWNGSATKTYELKANKLYAISAMIGSKGGSGSFSTIAYSGNYSNLGYDFTQPVAKGNARLYRGIIKTSSAGTFTCKSPSTVSSATSACALTIFQIG